MGRPIHTASIEIFAYTAPCAHTCRYCLIGPKQFENIGFSRFASFVDRFIAWKVQEGRDDLRLFASVQPSVNVSPRTMKADFELSRRLGWSEDSHFIRLGGLWMRSDEEMHDWLMELRDVSGLKGVHASLAGYGPVHDHWNRRKGDFEFLFSTMRSARDLGLKINQRLFVTRDSLPRFEELLDRLDSLEWPSLRYLSLFNYLGFATHLEAQRLTEEMRDSLPERIVQIQNRDGEAWLSEREWIARLEAASPTSQPTQLRLKVTEENLVQLEAGSCEEIVADLERRTLAAYDAAPSVDELRSSYGDRNGMLVYASADEVERLWFDRYLQEHPLTFDRELTHFATGH